MADTTLKLLVDLLIDESTLGKKFDAIHFSLNVALKEENLTSLNRNASHSIVRNK